MSGDLPRDQGWYPNECMFCTRDAALACTDPQCRARHLGEDYPDDVSEQVYHRAANSDLPDESFVMVSRAMRGKDPLTGDEPQPRPVRYFVDVDGDGVETLWRGERDDVKPTAIAMNRFPDDPSEEWQLLLRGAGLDGEAG